MEVPAYGEKGKAKFLEFFQGKLKKRIVIGLEPQMPAVLGLSYKEQGNCGK